jgi:chemotaxis protein methyltransferase CheR
MTPITDKEFTLFQRFIYDEAGISLSTAKKALVCGRLSKRVELHRLRNFTEYFRLLSQGSAAQEMQIAIDLLTTNETYFFREPRHFEVLKELAMEARGRAQPFRVWSAACSSGEEPYSIAMVLASTLQNTPFEVLGSDISSRVLERARTGHYPASRTTHIPKPYLHQFCLRGRGDQDGTVLVDKLLRERVRFLQVNLNEALPALGQFDCIFLRNVMIYFNAQTKRTVVERVASLLKPGGHLMIGHSETLNEITSVVVQRAPSLYCKP